MSRCFFIHASGVLVRRVEDRYVLPDEDPAGGLSSSEPHPVTDGAFAMSVDTIPEGYESLGARALAMALDAETFALAGRAMHVIDWATTNRFCGRCGTATVRSPKERAMTCPSCGLAAYARIAPAIIVLVRRGDEALLARNPKFPARLYSTLAGFSEIGESLEETLVREVHEEVGIRVSDIRYFGSQPWPFPHSLMLGFEATWAEGEIVVDGVEIADARWFTVDALPELPPPISIARQLIDAWVTDVRTGSGRTSR